MLPNLLALLHNSFRNLWHMLHICEGMALKSLPADWKVCKGQYCLLDCCSISSDLHFKETGGFLTVLIFLKL